MKMQLLLGLLIIFLLACTPTVRQGGDCQQLSDGTWRGDCDIEHMQEHMNSIHAHGTLEWDGEELPSVELRITQDAIGGFNVRIVTEGFVWAPEHINQEHVPGEGHGHLYVDGHKIARVYGEWYHIGSLEPGEIVLSVTLNSNSHETYTVEGGDLKDAVVITVPESGDMYH